MKREIPESVADAINTINSFCEDLYKNCDGCPFWIPYDKRNDDYNFCLFNKSIPAHWNVGEEKHYYIEYEERS